jgi:asparagine synthase (glutamine-hydrolysing)
MCGLAGLVSLGPPDPSSLRAMASSLAHRGPDDEGIWSDSESGVGFVHRRLSIVDLSPAGHQPMISRDGRWVLTFNGEIYNHGEVRAELEAQGEGPFRGHSDTETLLEAIARWGLETTLARCTGMFALALWDRRERRLSLVRDRFGEKPLYFGWVAGRFVFASELKALKRLPGFDNGLSREAQGDFLRLGYIPEPHSIYRRLYKLEPGCLIEASPEQLRAPLDSAPRVGGGLVRRWWSYRDVVVGGLADPIVQEGEALERLEAALLQSVRGQAMADVPVGAFLSGGIDSSTVVALYRQHAPVRTFTIGFEDAAFDEAPHARAIAAHLGTQHHEAYVTADEARQVIPQLAAIYDEPFADSSQIPTYLVCRHARAGVKVALSGDGGDELFGGYNRYLAAPRLWARLNRLPLPLRAAAGAALGLVPAGAWNGAADLAGRRSRQPHFGAKIRKTLRAMGQARGIDELHQSFVDEWQGERSPAGTGDLADLFGPVDLGAAPDTVRMMYRDAVTYLPGDILAKLDRASMAVSLETRLPLLDHRVAEVAARIPLAMKIDRGVGKQVLRTLLSRHVPPALLERPKTGFAVPVGEWLRGPLRSWADALLDPNSLRERGLDPRPIRDRWQAHLARRADWTASLWFVLMFQAWAEEG